MTAVTLDLSLIAKRHGRSILPPVLGTIAPVARGQRSRYGDYPRSKGELIVMPPTRRETGHRITIY